MLADDLVEKNLQWPYPQGDCRTIFMEPTKDVTFGRETISFSNFKQTILSETDFKMSGFVFKENICPSLSATL